MDDLWKVRLVLERMTLLSVIGLNKEAYEKGAIEPIIFRHVIKEKHLDPTVVKEISMTQI